MQKNRYHFYILIFSLLFITYKPAYANYVFEPTSPYHSLYVPNGDGPFPAILLLHASTGIERINYTWADLLRSQGYIVYMIDSFKPRGWKDRISVGWENATAAQLADVLPAYRYLKSLSIVDTKHIGLLGFSMGGFDVLRVMQNSSTPEEFQSIPFQAAASFYGVCHRMPVGAKLKPNTAIFIGAQDDRGTTSDCKELITKSNHVSISMYVYENALHGFDNFEFPASKEVVDEKGEHYHIGYNEQAGNLAKNDLLKFFAQKLK